MNDCAGASKATITIFLNGQAIEKIISNCPPINITLVHGQPAQIQGSGLNLDNCGQLNNYQIIEYSGFVELVSTSVPTPSSNPSGFCSGFKPSVNGVKTLGTNDVYHPSATIIRQYSSDWVLKVIDNYGKVITRKYSTQPTYTVACGDECPAGFCKCLTPEYPGYCCLDCGVVAAQIREIANSLRSK